MKKDRRVVVTGLGLRSPIGNSPAELLDAFLHNKSGIKRMADWAWIDHLRTQVGGTCLVNEEDAAIPRKYRRSMGRVAILAALAALDAVRESGLNPAEIASPACGVSFGSTNGSTAAQVESLHQIITQRSIEGVQASTYLKYMTHTCAGNLATFFGTQGPLMASATACVSGSQGIGHAYQAIQEGRAEMMIAGGAEEHHWMNAVVFDLMLATSTGYTKTPDQTPRPFDVDRDGLVVSEGAGCLVLEEFEHAQRRHGPILAELLGFWCNTSGKHLTNSDPDSMETCIRMALKNAGLNSEDVEHINAHATATPHGDEAEALAIHRVFGSNVPVSALKGYMGHTLGASGAIESIATIIMAQAGLMAPTKNLDTPDPAFPPLDHVLSQPRDRKFKIGMNNNFAFGGLNTSLIFGLV